MKPEDVLSHHLVLNSQRYDVWNEYPLLLVFKWIKYVVFLFKIEILKFYLQITACICVILKIYKSLICQLKS